MTIRPAQWPQDMAMLFTLDTSFVSETIYRPILDGLSFRLVEETVKPPWRKTYDFRPDDPNERGSWDYALIAEMDGQLAGFAAAHYALWNHRLEIQHLYVAPECRRHRVGTRLLASLEAYAQTVGARCLWLETQNVNAPAVRFYQNAGFRFCGFDTSLYDPANVPHNEIALFFARAVPKTEEGRQE